MKSLSLNIFRYHHPELRANPDQVQWNLDDDNDTWLPNMITDITLKSKDGRVLILDAKYCGQQMQSNFDVQTYRNANLYQIYTYVKNWDGQEDNVYMMELINRGESNIVAKMFDKAKACQRN